MTKPVDFTAVRCFIFDIDGVLTDGTVLVMENGLQARRMSIRDGYALQLAVKKGYRVAIVSGAAVSSVIDRLQKLGITDIAMGVLDKRSFIHDYITNARLDSSAVLFMGDDMPDLAAMRVVGFATCPADAIEEIKDTANYISPMNGGVGCVRDVIEQVLKANNHWGEEENIASR